MVSWYNLWQTITKFDDEKWTLIITIFLNTRINSGLIKHTITLLHKRYTIIEININFKVYLDKNLLEPTELGFLKSTQISLTWTGENLIICDQYETDAVNIQILLIYVSIHTIYFERSNHLITQIKQRNIRTCVPSAVEHNPTSLTKHVVAVKSDVKTFHQLPLEKIVLKKLFQVLHETMSEFSWDQ